jgi:uncharacterized protein YcgL (UPF0745 family)
MDSTSNRLASWIYRSSRKEEMYLYLRREADFAVVPAALLERFGRPEFVMRLELHAGRRLARADVGRVMLDLREQGYHLQMPPELKPTLYEGE